MAGAALLALLAALIRVPDNISDPACDLTGNAAWIGVEWVNEPPAPAAVSALSDDALRYGLNTLFVYTTYLREDGTFNPTYPHAQEFLEMYREANPDTRLLAWVGVPLANERPIGVHGWADLGDAATRSQITSLAEQLTADSGFDGIHLNAETVQNNDASYLLLLDELREALGPSKMLSIAGSHWVPKAVNTLPVLHNFRWTSDYYREVAARVNQIAVMTYDSVMPHPALYRWWMRTETMGLHRTLRGTGVEWLLGISVSREDTVTHHPAAESLRAGLAGVCAGIRRGSTPDGIAVYALWDFAEGDRDTWAAWAT